ncbi:MAG: ferritin-like domain-containing protein [Actinomycetota bacterium]|nr:ferritin-like domain-containing protein [Actinomycetota bacterium]
MTDPTADGPGALRELHDPASRKRFLRLGGAGIAGALAMTLAACGSSGEEGAGARERTLEVTTEPKADPGLRRFGSGDLAIANYALTLEYIETDFYEAVIDSDLLTGEVLELARRFGEHESQHVEALRGLIQGAGGTAIERPETKFEFSDERSLLQTAATVEDLGASAYLGQAARISSEEILAAALSIHSVEARHAAALREVTGAEPAPRAFSEPADAATVLAAVRPFLA